MWNAEYWSSNIGKTKKFPGLQKKNETDII